MGGQSLDCLHGVSRPVTLHISELRLVCLNTIFLFYRISSKIGTFAESKKGVCRSVNLEGIL